MTVRALVRRALRHERLNFVLTNRIPRRQLTRFMGWFSRIEQPLVRDLSIRVWCWFGDVDLAEAKKSRFSSLHDCFIREIRPEARPVDPDPAVLTSPVDAIVGPCGRVRGGELLQAKGCTYRLDELLCDPVLAGVFGDGCYATLRITAGMYHRFHAPHDCRVERVTYVAGDTWNVNPAALKRVDRLYCRNERAIVRATLARGGHRLVLVPVAAVLVASIRFGFMDVRQRLRRRGVNEIACDATLAKGEEMGWFEHGSTLLVFVPGGFSLCERVRPGETIRMGQALMRMPFAEPG